MTATTESLPKWSRAHGEPVLPVQIRSCPADFQVVERLPFEASGGGEHDLVEVRKTGANTDWVARRLAKHARVPVRDVGFAGLKDRHAVTTQYFSVRRATGEGTDWSSFSAPGVEILGVERHARKLRRGAHSMNVFLLVARADGIEDHRDAIGRRWAAIAARGVPNYFGPQRFGRGGANVAQAREVLAGKRVRRDTRSLALSAGRSLLFNEILSARVADGSWEHILAGEIANLDGSRSVFSVDEPTPQLNERCAGFDIHPTGTLWGPGAPLASGDVAELELEAVRSYPDIADGLAAAGPEAASRPLRLRPQDADAEFAPGCVRLSFSLPPGAFATSVIRELFNVR